MSGPGICRMIGEPHNVIDYQDCLKCRHATCPIRMLFSLMSHGPQRERIYELEREMA